MKKWIETMRLTAGATRWRLPGWIAVWLLAAPAMAGARDTSAAYIEVNGVTLRYQLDGSGSDLVVLLPSTGKPLEYWDEILPSLRRHNRRFLRYDIRGVGLSQKLTQAITMQDEVDDLAALLDALELRGRVTMVGVAFGGSIEMQYAAQHPDRVRGIVNISPSAQLVGRSLHTEPRTVANAPAPESDPYAFTYPAKLRTNPQRWRTYAGLERSNDPLSKRLTEALIYSTPFADVMPRIQCPVLMVATLQYLRRTPAEVQELSMTLPHGDFTVLDSGHDAPFQTPELVAPVLREFFKKSGI
ncbi:MAG: alpha/beta hydrolase [Steroidobacteraceae bacterium]